MDHRTAAASALTATGTDRARLAGRYEPGMAWRHAAAYGLAVGMIPLSTALLGAGLGVAWAVVSMLGCAAVPAVVLHRRRVLGFAPRPGRDALLPAAGIGVVGLVGSVLARAAGRVPGPGGPAAAALAVLGVVVVTALLVHGVDRRRAQRPEAP